MQWGAKDYPKGAKRESCVMSASDVPANAAKREELEIRLFVLLPTATRDGVKEISLKGCQHRAA